MKHSPLTIEEKYFFSKYYKFLLAQQEKLVIKDVHCKQNIIEIKDLSSEIEEIQGRLSTILKTGVCSSFLIEQLALHMKGFGEKYKINDADRIYFFHAQSILERIRKAEDNGRGIENFNRKTLKGYSKLHHSFREGKGYSIYENVKNFWFDNIGNLKNNRLLEAQNIFNLQTQNLAQLLNELHNYALGNKERLTGEWLIVKKYNNKNYYLCLAAHDEGDLNLIEGKINIAIQDFPELQNHCN